MQSTANNIVTLAIAQAVLFVVLILIVYFVIKNHSSFQGRIVRKSKMLAEQDLVMEAISACVSENDFPGTITAIGKHAAEVTGYSQWLFWILDDQAKELRVCSASTGFALEEIAALKKSHDPELYAWVRQNGEASTTDRFISSFADGENLKLIFEKSGSGLMIPFIDGKTMHGFIVLSDERSIREKRSKQFLSLFGAIAGIILKKSKMDQKQSALKQKQLRTENLASLGQLAAGLAHEIRTPLTLIKSATQHLNEYYDYEPQDQELATVITEEINKINHQISDLLILGRIAPAEFQKVDLKNVIEKTAKLGLSKAKENNVKITCKLPQEDICVLGSESLLAQLYRNLVLNAIDAMERGGELKLITHLDGGRVKTLIEDNGPGIPQEIKAKIFQPFFTTKSIGTGLGLSVSYNIAKAHEGELELLRSDARGTVFSVDMPLNKQTKGKTYA